MVKRLPPAEIEIDIRLLAGDNVVATIVKLGSKVAKLRNGVI